MSIENSPCVSGTREANTTKTKQKNTENILTMVFLNLSKNLPLISHIPSRNFNLWFSGSANHELSYIF